MKRKLLWIPVVLVLILALLPVSEAQAFRSKLLYLDDHQVVPAGSGDPNMFGEATIEVNAGRGRLCYWMRVFIYPAGDNWPPTSAGIYNAPVRQNGPRVVDLDPSWGSRSDNEVSGCIAIDKDLAHAIQRRPGQYYLLLTDVDYPEGATRAQLSGDRLLE